MTKIHKKTHSKLSGKIAMKKKKCGFLKNHGQIYVLILYKKQLINIF